MSGKEIAFPPMSGRQIDNIAYQLIRRADPRAFLRKGLFDVERFVDNQLEDLTGIVADYRKDLPEEIYGFTDSAQNRIVINANLIDDPFFGTNEQFLRSTLGHETGHCFLHVPILKRNKRERIFTQGKEEESVKLYRKTAIPIYQNPEWQAHRFGAALLIPEELLRYHLEKGETINKLAEIFGVYPAFVRSRLRGLKIMAAE